MLAGHVPFPDGGWRQKMIAHHEGVPTDLTRLRKDVPRSLAAVVCKMMAKRPADRYATPAEVAGALRPFCRRDVGSLDDTAISQKSGSSMPRLAALAAILALGVASFLAVRFFPWRVNDISSDGQHVSGETKPSSTTVMPTTKSALPTSDARESPKTADSGQAPDRPTGDAEELRTAAPPKSETESSKIGPTKEANVRFSEIEIEAPFDKYLLAKPVFMEQGGAAAVIRLKNGNQMLLCVGSAVLADDSSEELAAARVKCRMRRRRARCNAKACGSTIKRFTKTAES